MPLPQLPNESFSHRCPHCGVARVNTGQWFRAIGGYKCKGCGDPVRVSRPRGKVSTPEPKLRGSPFLFPSIFTQNWGRRRETCLIATTRSTSRLQKSARIINRLGSSRPLMLGCLPRHSILNVPAPRKSGDGVKMGNRPTERAWATRP
jgi:hypothetical protein